MRAALVIGFLGALAFTGCSSDRDRPVTEPPEPRKTRTLVSLPDRAVFEQGDERWRYIRLGGSGEPLYSHGCLITGVAMGLVNLGFETDPGNLTETLVAHNGFNSRGWIIWKAVEDATAGEAKVTFYQDPDPEHVRQCLARGDYPLVKFTLDSGMPHWLLVLAEKEDDFYVRDPYAATPEPFAMRRRTPHIEAVRCVGVRD